MFRGAPGGLAAGRKQRATGGEGEHLQPLIGSDTRTTAVDAVPVSSSARQQINSPVFTSPHDLLYLHWSQIAKQLKPNILTSLLRRRPHTNAGKLSTTITMTFLNLHLGVTCERPSSLLLLDHRLVPLPKVTRSGNLKTSYPPTLTKSTGVEILPLLILTTLCSLAKPWIRRDSRTSRRMSSCIRPRWCRNCSCV